MHVVLDVDAVDNNNNNTPSSDMILDAKPAANRNVSAAAAFTTSTKHKVMGQSDGSSILRYFGSLGCRCRQ